MAAQSPHGAMAAYIHACPSLSVILFFEMGLSVDARQRQAPSSIGQLFVSNKNRPPHGNVRICVWNDRRRIRQSRRGGHHPRTAFFTWDYRNFTRYHHWRRFPQRAIRSGFARANCSAVNGVRVSRLAFICAKRFWRLGILRISVLYGLLNFGHDCIRRTKLSPWRTCRMAVRDRKGHQSAVLHCWQAFRSVRFLAGIRPTALEPRNDIRSDNSGAYRSPCVCNGQRTFRPLGSLR